MCYLYKIQYIISIRKIRIFQTDNSQKTVQPTVVFVYKRRSERHPARQRANQLASFSQEPEADWL